MTEGQSKGPLVINVGNDQGSSDMEKIFMAKDEVGTRINNSVSASSSSLSVQRMESDRCALGVRAIKKIPVGGAVTAHTRSSGLHSLAAIRPSARPSAESRSVQRGSRRIRFVRPSLGRSVGRYPPPPSIRSSPLSFPRLPPRRLAAERRLPRPPGALGRALGPFM